jgi:cytochrome c biogenesis protein CcdA
MDISPALAFAAGLLSFASPCVLALVPVYLAFLGETAGATSSSAIPAGGATVLRGPVLVNALLFTAGFAAVFTLIGVSIGLLGTALFRISEVRQAAGIAVIVVGLLTTGIFGPVFDSLPARVRGDRLPNGRAARSLALGALVAIGWTPCIGPVLGTILLMGASTQDAGVATILLVALPGRRGRAAAAAPGDRGAATPPSDRGGGGRALHHGDGRPHLLQLLLCHLRHLRLRLAGLARSLRHPSVYPKRCMRRGRPCRAPDLTACALPRS